MDYILLLFLLFFFIVVVVVVVVVVRRFIHTMSRRLPDRRNEEEENVLEESNSHASNNNNRNNNNREISVSAMAAVVASPPQEQEQALQSTVVVETVRSNEDGEDDDDDDISTNNVNNNNNINNDTIAMEPQEHCRPNRNHNNNDRGINDRQQQQQGAARNDDDDDDENVLDLVQAVLRRGRRSLALEEEEQQPPPPPQPLHPLLPRPAAEGAAAGAAAGVPPPQQRQRRRPQRRSYRRILGNDDGGGGGEPVAARPIANHDHLDDAVGIQGWDLIGFGPGGLRIPEQLILPPRQNHQHDDDNNNHPPPPHDAHAAVLAHEVQGALVRPALPGGVGPAGLVAVPPDRAASLAATAALRSIWSHCCLNGGTVLEFGSHLTPTLATYYGAGVGATTTTMTSSSSLSSSSSSAPNRVKSAVLKALIKRLRQHSISTHGVGTGATTSSATNSATGNWSCRPLPFHFIVRRCAFSNGAAAQLADLLEFVSPTIVEIHDDEYDSDTVNKTGDMGTASGTTRRTMPYDNHDDNHDDDHDAYEESNEDAYDRLRLNPYLLRLQPNPPRAYHRYYIHQIGRAEMGGGGGVGLHMVQQQEQEQRPARLIYRHVRQPRRRRRPAAAAAPQEEGANHNNNHNNNEEDDEDRLPAPPPPPGAHQRNAARMQVAREIAMALRRQQQQQEQQQEQQQQEGGGGRRERPPPPHDGPLQARGEAAAVDIGAAVQHAAVAAAAAFRAAEEAAEGAAAAVAEQRARLWNQVQRIPPGRRVRVVVALEPEEEARRGGIGEQDNEPQEQPQGDQNVPQPPTAAAAAGVAVANPTGSPRIGEPRTDRRNSNNNNNNMNNNNIDHEIQNENDHGRTANQNRNDMAATANPIAASLAPVEAHIAERRGGGQAAPPRVAATEAAFASLSAQAPSHPPVADAPAAPGVRDPLRPVSQRPTVEALAAAVAASAQAGARDLPGARAGTGPGAPPARSEGSRTSGYNNNNNNPTTGNAPNHNSSNNNNNTAATAASENNTKLLTHDTVVGLLSGLVPPPSLDAGAPPPRGLQVLRLKGLGLRHEGIMRLLCCVLRHHRSTLSILCLSGCRWNIRSITQLARTLLQLQPYETVTACSAGFLYHAHNSNNSPPPVLLSSSLLSSRSTALEKLYLNGSEWITDVMIRILITALCSHTTTNTTILTQLTTLSLIDNPLMTAVGSLPALTSLLLHPQSNLQVLQVSLDLRPPTNQDVLDAATGTTRTTRTTTTSVQPQTSPPPYPSSQLEEPPPLGGNRNRRNNDSPVDPPPVADDDDEDEVMDDAFTNAKSSLVPVIDLQVRHKAIFTAFANALAQHKSLVRLDLDAPKTKKKGKNNNNNKATNNKSNYNNNCETRHRPIGNPYLELPQPPLPEEPFLRQNFVTIREGTAGDFNGGGQRENANVGRIGSGPQGTTGETSEETTVLLPDVLVSFLQAGDSSTTIKELRLYRMLHWRKQKTLQSPRQSHGRQRKRRGHPNTHPKPSRSVTNDSETEERSLKVLRLYPTAEANDALFRGIATSLSLDRLEFINCYHPPPPPSAEAPAEAEDDGKPKAVPALSNDDDNEDERKPSALSSVAVAATSAATTTTTSTMTEGTVAMLLGLTGLKTLKLNRSTAIPYQVVFSSIYIHSIRELYVTDCQLNDDQLIQLLMVQTTEISPQEMMAAAAASSSSTAAAPTLLLSSSSSTATVAKSTALHTLSLSINKLTPASLWPLVQFLKSNPQLKTLDLSYNHNLFRVSSASRETRNRDPEQEGTNNESSGGSGGESQGAVLQSFLEVIRGHDSNSKLSDAPGPGSCLETLRLTECGLVGSNSSLPLSLLTDYYSNPLRKSLQLGCVSLDRCGSVCDDGENAAAAAGCGDDGGRWSMYFEPNSIRPDNPILLDGLSSMRNVESLMLQYAPGPWPQAHIRLISAALAPVCQLKHLTLNLPVLRNPTGNRETVTTIVNGVRVHPTLETLRLSSPAISDTAMHSLADALSTSTAPRLKVLNFRRVSITSDSLAAFVKILQDQTELQSLELSCCALFHRVSDMDRIEPLLEALSGHGCLKELSLRECRLGGTVLRGIFRALEQPQTPIHMLDIAGNTLFSMSDDDWSLWVDHLPRLSKRLRHLKLPRNVWVHEKWVDFVHRLQPNVSICSVQYHGVPYFDRFPRKSNSDINSKASPMYNQDVPDSMVAQIVCRNRHLRIVKQIMGEKEEEDDAVEDDMNSTSMATISLPSVLPHMLHRLGSNNGEGSALFLFLKSGIPTSQNSLLSATARGGGGGKKRRMGHSAYSDYDDDPSPKRARNGGGSP